MAFQSLYRRYRPRRFEQVRGQEHAMRALRNAVRDGTVSHAYLFSGPRGTGKTSTARILAKALNCESPVEGEPDGTCESCLAVEAGRSLDVVELDAASNNGVDAMRDLVARVALGSGGRAKVYIVDEVHMLSAAAANALLKTLEEPPPHVTFVLATTDPQKVLPTIKSRTQHFEFRLLTTTLLTEHLQWVVADAGLHVDGDAIASAARRGRGSARDALSALDQIVAAGGAADDDSSLDEIAEALCERDTARALAAVAMSCSAGREPRQLAESLLAHLRDALLSVLAPDVVSLPDEAKEQVADQGRRLGAPTVVRALDAIGEALLAMREAPDQRVVLEVALVRVTRPELDTSLAGVVERVERLERALRDGPPSSPAPSSPPASPRPEPSGASGARRALGAVRRGAPADPPTAPPTAPPVAPPPPAHQPVVAPPPSGKAMPTRDELTTAWGDEVMRGLRVKVKGLYGSGRFVGVEDGVALFGFESDKLREMAEAVRTEVETALGTCFGREVPLRLVVVPSGGRDETAAPGEEEAHDPAELRDAPVDHRSPMDHLTTAFPGAEVVEGDS